MVHYRDQPLNKFIWHNHYPISLAALTGGPLGLTLSDLCIASASSVCKLKGLKGIQRPLQLDFFCIETNKHSTGAEKQSRIQYKAGFWRELKLIKCNNHKQYLFHIYEQLFDPRIKSYEIIKHEARKRITDSKSSFELHDCFHCRSR